MAKTLEEVAINKLADYLDRATFHIPAAAGFVISLPKPLQERVFDLIVNIIHRWSLDYENSGGDLSTPEIAATAWSMYWGYQNTQFVKEKGQ